MPFSAPRTWLITLPMNSFDGKPIVVPRMAGKASVGGGLVQEMSRPGFESFDGIGSGREPQQGIIQFSQVDQCIGKVGPITPVLRDEWLPSRPASAARHPIGTPIRP